MGRGRVLIGVRRASQELQNLILWILLFFLWRFKIWDPFGGILFW